VVQIPDSARTRSDPIRFVVQPGAVVWIRVRERVAMPTNMCGLWLQTNTLSRKGLLLINASLVEPGYEGHLSCHFVNFSKEPVEIFPNTALVKLLFMKLDRESAEPFTQRITNYDTMIAGLASRSAKSFLQISEITARLEDARKNAELDLKRVGELESQRLKNQLDSDSRQRRMDEIEAIKKDVESYVRRALGAAAAGVILLGLIMLGVQWLHSRITIDEAGLDQRIERSLGRHVTFVGANPSLQPATTSFPLRDAGSVTVPTANDQ